MGFDNAHSRFTSLIANAVPNATVEQLALFEATIIARENETAMADRAMADDEYEALTRLLTAY